MKYTLDEAVEEFARRREILQKKKEERISKVLAAGAGVLSILLIVVLAAVISPSVPGQGESSYGSFLLAQDAGEYIVIALIAFVLGILVTFAILYKNGRLKSRKHDVNSTKKG